MTGLKAGRGLDVVTVGRASVDLYGVEMGASLEDASHFRRSVGGCPANVAIGCARLGLRSAIVSRVGDEAMGRFVLARMAREGVDVSGIGVDPSRLTALVLLATPDRATAPHLFVRTDCADMALRAEHVDPALMARAGCVVVTGTHFSTPGVAEASLRAIALARGSGAKVVLDLDVRPSLWGLAPQGEGEARLVADSRIRTALAPVIATADLVVGTEEEFRSALAEPTLDAAMAAARRLGSSVLVLKRGAEGCEVHAAPGHEPIRGERFDVEVVNAIGAGDAFLAGLLRGWLGGEGWAAAAAWANACGALAVSRLMCSAEYPTWDQLQAFIVLSRAGRPAEAARVAADLHRAAGRPPIRTLFALAVDHRTQFREVADRHGAPHGRLGAFKRLAVAAASDVAARLSREESVRVGILCDGEHGEAALLDAARAGLWVARPVETAGSRPLSLVTGPDVGSALLSWPEGQVVKCLVHYATADPEDLRRPQEETLLRLAAACRTLRRELLLEVIPPSGPADRAAAVAAAMERLYDLGLRPDWWKLEPFDDPGAWARLSEVVARRDPTCQGILVLGLDRGPDAISRAFAASSRAPGLRGFAVGRAIVAQAFEGWLAGRLDDEAARAAMADRLRALIAAWDEARS